MFVLCWSYFVVAVVIIVAVAVADVVVDGAFLLRKGKLQRLFFCMYRANLMCMSRWMENRKPNRNIKDEPKKKRREEVKKRADAREERREQVRWFQLSWVSFM